MHCVFHMANLSASCWTQRPTKNNIHNNNNILKSRLYANSVVQQLSILNKNKLGYTRYYFYRIYIQGYKKTKTKLVKTPSKTQ